MQSDAHAPAVARRALSRLLDCLWPHTCLACRSTIDTAGLCEPCAAAWRQTVLDRTCQRCARPLPVGALDPCRGCATERHWNVRGLVAAARYDGPVRDLLLRLKFAGDPPVAAWCGRVLADAIRAAGWADDIDLLVPVPMHPLRRWHRAGDHARLLADEAGRILRRPVRSVLRRTRPVPSQARSTSRTERFRQVRDSFGPRRGRGVQGRTVCIVDNVLVTGATIHEVSRTLRAAGAKRVFAAVVGRD